MADSKIDPGQLKPPTIIKTALEKEGAFTSHFAFRATSSGPLTTLGYQLPDLWSSPSLSSVPAPEITVTGRADGGCEVAVRLTSMHFIPEYRDPRSLARKRLEIAAREEIIRSLKLRRDEVGDGDIEVDIREGSLRFFIRLSHAIVSITIAALMHHNNEHDINRVRAGATGAVLGAAAGVRLGPMAMAIGGAIGFVAGTVFGDSFFR